MAITYNAGTNTITVTGYTEAVPCTLLDIYNADVAGGWGRVSKQGSQQFYFSNGVRLIIGDGSTLTWFGDTNKLVEISDLVGTGWQTFMDKKANANIRFGTIISGKRTKDGCAFYHYPVGNAFSLVEGSLTSGVTDMFSCAFFGDDARFHQCTGLKLYNCASYGDMRIVLCNSIDVYNYNLNNGYRISGSSTGIYERIFGSDVLYATYISGAGADITFKDVTVRNNTYVARGYSTSRNLYLVNFDVDTWAFTYSTFSGKFYRQYEFDLKVQDKDENAINGATVKIWDKDNNLVVDTTTDATGKIAVQTLNYGYYNQAGGDTPVMQTPHKIQIRKAGTNYLTYETDFTINKKTDWVIMMVDMSDLIDEINANEVKIDEGFEDVKIRIDDLEVLGLQKT